MEKILLISNRVLHYRQKIYNNFFFRFKEKGYDFQVLADSVQKVDYKLDYKIYEQSFSVHGYIDKIKEINPQYVILFLHLKDKVMFPIIWYCKLKKIPVIYWNHGINLADANNKFKNAIYHHIHDISDALITYTPDMRTNFANKNHNKLFVAYNTLDFSDIDKDKVLLKEKTKEKYNIREKKVILYASRILPYKGVDILMKLFAGVTGVAVVIVGPGISKEQQEIVDKYNNLYYLGEKYGADINEIYKMSDIFSTPGHIGLAMNEALFWGLPVIVLNRRHAPEIYYMKNGITGYIAKDEDELKAYILNLVFDEDKLKSMSDACLQVYQEEASIEKMFKGFWDAIEYCSNRGI